MICIPPHCDTMDGPVVKAAKKALETGNVNFILPWVYEGGEKEVREAFEKASQVRKLGNKDATALSDLWFFEVTVRVHRQGEGAPYTGLKPAGLDEGPIIHRIDEAMISGNIREVVAYLHNEVQEAVEKRFLEALSRKNYDENDVKSAREFVQAFLGLTLFSHHLHEYIMSGGAHGEGEGSGGHSHEHKQEQHEHKEEHHRQKEEHHKHGEEHKKKEHNNPQY